MGFGSNTASGLRSSYLHLCIRYYGKCAGIWDILYVGVFSYDMACSTSTADKENENGYHDQSDYEEGQQIKNHRAVSE